MRKDKWVLWAQYNAWIIATETRERERTTISSYGNLKALLKLFVGWDARVTPGEFLCIPYFSQCMPLCDKHRVFACDDQQ